MLIALLLIGSGSLYLLHRSMLEDERAEQQEQQEGQEGLGGYDDVGLDEEDGVPEDGVPYRYSGLYEGRPGGNSVFNPPSQRRNNSLDRSVLASAGSRSSRTPYMLEVLRGARPEMVRARARASEMLFKKAKR